QLTGGIAHDFNNILGVILGNISLLKTEVSTEGKIPKRVDTIQKAAQRAAELTKQLLSFSRKKGVDVCPININRLIQDTDQLISHSITPEVEVEERFSDNLWLTEIDRSDFEDTLLNLILNARDAMPDGGQLTIGTRNCVLDAAFCNQNPEASPGEYVQLSVSDSGIGITSEEMEHVFEPFFTTKPIDKGTGLGLSMVFGFINRSQGHIEVHSEPDIGTTFNLYLPRASNREEQQQQDDINDYQFDETRKRDELILIVDDEPGLLELAQDSLQSQGYRILVASNGKQALELLVNNPDISLLFTDVVMPGGMSGYDLAERATIIHPGLKVLLTSGHAEKTASHDGKADFDADLISKPYSLPELTQHVHSLLGDPGVTATDQDDTSGQAVPPAAGIEWTEDLAISINPIDEDHKVLVELLNRSMLLTRSESAQREFEQVLTELLEHTQYHFKREEAVMQICGYPDIDFHRQIHQFLINQATQKQQQLQSGHLSAEELVDFLSGWLLNHIEVVDRAIAPFCVGKEELVFEAT
ncbi:MAG: bacteriohemerythrin, partial [Gammaproteobacteria bacterium]|nr:bacteriohemerythrin [Gammaproteobacteria bacterium]